MWMGQADSDRVDASTEAPSAGVGTVPTPIGEGMLAQSGRPDPGTLARGVWEAPAWAFYVTAGVVLLAALLHGARLTGILRRRKSRAS
jgi:hypothetical protein